MNEGKTGIYLGPELKLDQLSSLYLETIGLECQVAFLVGDLDDVHVD